MIIIVTPITITAQTTIIIVTLITIIPLTTIIIVTLITIIPLTMIIIVTLITIIPLTMIVILIFFIIAPTMIVFERHFTGILRNFLHHHQLHAHVLWPYLPHYRRADIYHVASCNTIEFNIRESECHDMMIVVQSSSKRDLDVFGPEECYIAHSIFNNKSIALKLWLWFRISVFMLENTYKFVVR